MPSVLRSTASRSRIPQPVLVRARESTDVASLEKPFKLLSPETYTLSLIDVALHHLDPARRITPPVPDSLLRHRNPLQEPQYLEELRLQDARARAALLCGSVGLSALLKHCPGNLRQQATDRIVPHLDDILSWYEYFGTSAFLVQKPEEHYFVGDPSRPCEALWRIFTVDEWGPLKEHLMRSVDKLVGYAISAWLAKDPRVDYGPFLLKSWSYSSAGQGPIEHLMKILLSHDESRQRLYDILLDSPTLLARLLDSATFRCKYISGLTKSEVKEYLADDASAAVEAIFKCLDQVMIVVVKLCDHPVLAKDILKSDFFQYLTEATVSWLNQSDVKHDEKISVQAFETMARVQALIVTEREKSGAHWKGCSRTVDMMMRGGYMDILYHGLHSRVWRAREVTVQLLQILRSECDGKPSIARKLLDRLKYLRGDNFADPHFLPDCGSHEYWAALATQAAAGGLYDKEEILPLCDNLSCPGDRRQFEASRVCSGCHSLVYCSPECQREDWKALHRQECTKARNHFYQDPLADIPQYTQSMRLFHAELTVRRARVASEPGWQTTAGVPAILEIDSLNGKSEPSVHTIDDYLPLRPLQAAHTCSGPDRPVSYFADRVKALLRSHDAEQVEAGIRIAECNYLFGPNVIYMLVKYQEESFKLLYTVAVFESVEHTPKQPGDDDYVEWERDVGDDYGDYHICHARNH